ncbi:MAG: DMT family transporter [Candidatus Roizmanbacteria bacterium]|nr:MAG: DMT family transporter [Candidatus Roizmanbacteria bacterium]
MFKKELTDNNKAFIAILLAAFLGGGVPVLIKIALKEIPPLSFTFLRFFSAAIFILPFFLRNKPLIGKNIHKLIFISILASVNVTLFAFGIRLTSATVGQTLHTSIPIIAAVLSYFLLKEKITKKKSLGILVGFIGTSVIIFLPMMGNVNFLQSSLIGNIIIFIGAVSFSFYLVMSKKLHENFSPFYLTTIFVLTTIVIQFFLASTEFISNPQWLFKISMGGLLATLYVGVIGTFIYYLLYQYAIKHGSPIIASMTLYLQPAATFIWALLLLNERLTTGFIIGAILVFIGVWITSRS